MQDVLKKTKTNADGVICGHQFNICDFYIIVRPASIV